VPSQDWTNGDTEARERLTGPLHRVVILRDLVSQIARHPSFKSSTNVVKTSGTTAQQFPYSREVIKRAREHAGGLARSALDRLLAWDGNYARTSADGTIDPGAAIWEAFKSEAARIALSQLGPGAELLDGGAGGSHRYDIRNAEAYALLNLSPDKLATAARRAAGHLAERFGTDEPGSWRDPRLKVELAAQGAGQSPDLPFFDRGTWNHSVELGR
jgi:hypothetical protein